VIDHFLGLELCPEMCVKKTCMLSGARVHGGAEGVENEVVRGFAVG